MHVFQPLEHFTLSLEHCQHFLCDSLVPRDTALPSLFSGLEDPRDPLASTLPLVERPRGEDGLCRLAHGEDLDGRGGEEDGLAEERLRWEMCGCVATGIVSKRCTQTMYKQKSSDAQQRKYVVDRLLGVRLFPVLHEAVCEEGERGVGGGGEAVRGVPPRRPLGGGRGGGGRREGRGGGGGQVPDRGEPRGGGGGGGGGILQPPGGRREPSYRSEGGAHRHRGGEYRGEQL